jgi:hypothetical protein
MVMPQRSERSDSERLRVAAVTFACAANLLSSILLNIQNYVVDTRFLHRDPALGYPEIVSEFILLAPVLVVVIFRRATPFVLLSAASLGTILVGRIYYLVQLYSIGIGGVDPKLDWPVVVLSLLGTASLVVVSFWAMVHFGFFIDSCLKRRLGEGR